MPGRARKEIFDPTTVGVYHCYNRCVRKAFLCGIDCEEGQDHGHRKEWIRQRLEGLASAFGIDVASVLACSIYVDLNPIRAMLAQTPESSLYTSAYERIQDLQSQTATTPTEAGATVALMADTADVELVMEVVAEPTPASTGERSGWLAPILDRIGIQTGKWLEAVSHFGQWFGHVAGRAAAVIEHARETGHPRWGGTGRCREAFG